VLANAAIILAGFITAYVQSIWPDLIVGLGIAAINADAAREVWRVAKDERLAADSAEAQFSGASRGPSRWFFRFTLRPATPVLALADRPTVQTLRLCQARRRIAGDPLHLIKTHLLLTLFPLNNHRIGHGG